VRKIPLDERCVEVGYDITRPQPQLFVAPSFEALHEVLQRVAASLAEQQGGALALSRALASEELCTVRFSSGASVMGTLVEVGPGLAEPAWLRFEGPVAVGWDGKIPEEAPELHRSDGLFVVVGGPRDGGSLAEASDRQLARALEPASGRHRFGFATGAEVRGRLERCERQRNGRLAWLELGAVTLTLPGRAPLELPRYRLLVAGTVVTAHAGAADPRYHPDTARPETRVPKPRRFSSGERARIELHEQVERARGLENPEPALRRVYDTFAHTDPEEWLLRFVVLEGLLKAGREGALSQTIAAELEALEVRLERRQPIASGLRYLKRFAA
jgi:phenylalanine-4-hydroxylase